MFGRKDTPEVPEVEAGPNPGDTYTGGVCFRDGFHYPILYNPDGSEIGPDVAHPLVWVGDNGSEAAHYEYAAQDAPTHFHTHGLNPIELVVD